MGHNESKEPWRKKKRTEKEGQRRGQTFLPNRGQDMTNRGVKQWGKRGGEKAQKGRLFGA